MKREKSKVVIVRVPARLSARFATLSKRRKVSVSEIVREAMEAYARKGDTSLWDSASHIFDSAGFQGAPDLSTNKKHLKGYGK